MAVGSNPYNIDFTLVLFNVWFAFVILFRESFDSPYPQSSCLDWMVLRISIAMVPWSRSPRSFPAPIAIDPPTLLFVYSPCHAFNYFLLLVWHVTWFGLYSILNMFPFFSDCHFVLRTIYLPSLFQALTTCKDIMSFEEETSQVNCIWCASYVGSMYDIFPQSVNPVGAVNFGQYRFWVGHFEKPRRGRLHGGATLSWYYFHTKKYVFVIQ